MLYCGITYVTKPDRWNLCKCKSNHPVGKLESNPLILPGILCTEPKHQQPSSTNSQGRKHDGKSRLRFGIAMVLGLGQLFQTKVCQQAGTKTANDNANQGAHEEESSV